MSIIGRFHKVEGQHAIFIVEHPEEKRDIQVIVPLKNVEIDEHNPNADVVVKSLDNAGFTWVKHKEIRQVKGTTEMLKQIAAAVKNTKPELNRP